ncbi:MAG: hypothetical protein WD397_06210 [Wenzhouxiangellaceae bacterium]
MHNYSNSSGYVDYRVFERDRIDRRELETEPDPSRLRTACLMIYAGLLLSLAAMLTSAQVAAFTQTGALEARIESSNASRQAADGFRSLPQCDERRHLSAFTDTPTGLDPRSIVTLAAPAVLLDQLLLNLGRYRLVV